MLVRGCDVGLGPDLMLYAGVDTSTTSTGFVIVAQDASIYTAAVWERPKKADQAGILVDYWDWINDALEADRKHIKIVGLERLSSSMNMDTTRKLGYMEGITYLAAANLGLDVFSISAVSARKKALGRSKGKEDAYEVNCERHGAKFFEDFGKKAKYDISDALTVAEATRLSMQPGG